MGTGRIEGHETTRRRWSAVLCTWQYTGAPTASPALDDAGILSMILPVHAYTRLILPTYYHTTSMYTQQALESGGSRRNIRRARACHPHFRQPPVCCLVSLFPLSPLCRSTPSGAIYVAVSRYDAVLKHDAPSRDPRVSLYLYMPFTIDSHSPTHPPSTAIHPPILPVRCFTHPPPWFVAQRPKPLFHSTPASPIATVLGLHRIVRKYGLTCLDLDSPGLRLFRNYRYLGTHSIADDVDSLWRPSGVPLAPLWRHMIHLL